MKPSFGLLPRTGVLKTSDTLDTLGFITSRVDNIRDILEIMRVKGPNYPFVYNNLENKKKKLNLKKIKIGFVVTDRCLHANDYVRNDFLKFIQKLKKNFDVKEIIWPKKLKNLGLLHETIYTKNLSYYFSKEYKEKSKKISKIMNQMIFQGKKISTKKYLESLSQQKKSYYRN